MMQLLNNIWIALSSENTRLVNLLTLPLYPIETLVLMNLFLAIFNIKSTWKQKLIYVICNSFISIINTTFIPSPYNVLINYTSTFILIKIIFKLNLLKTFVSLIMSTFIFGLLNVLIQNPYLKILDISPETFMNVPIYRIPYLLLLYCFLSIICVLLKNIKTTKVTLDLLDSLDKKTLRILFINLIIGFLALCVQLITTAYYIDIVPIIITILNFILLISFFILSIYSFTRMIKLANARRDLQNAEEYNKSLEILYDKVKGFKHDFSNIMSTFGGYLDNDDIAGAKEYLTEVKKDCKITNNLSILNPRIINNPGIYSLLNNKYFKATKLGIDINIDFFLDLNSLNINTYQFSRILGILLDNAIEATELCNEKIIRIIFRRENKNNRAIILIKNTYSNKNVDTEEIFKKGISEKKEHSGIGLWEVRNYIKRSQNLNLFTSKNDKYFIQQLEIYD